MSAATTTQIVAAARKAHQCTYCGTRIEIGETYKRYRYFDGGDAGTVKIHPECLDAFHSLDWIDQVEGFSTGESPRGCTCGHSVGCENCASIRKGLAA